MWLVKQKEREDSIMSKTAVVYWSGTGNTEAMAAKVVEGAQAAKEKISLQTACFPIIPAILFLLSRVP